MHVNWFDCHKNSSALIETIILSVGGFLLGSFFLPDQPFFATQGFTWLMIGPFMSGLRYGFGYALSSVLLIIALLFIAQSYQLPWANGHLPTLGLVLLLVAFVTGEFSNYWKRRVKKLEASVNYLDQRLNQTGNTFNILEKSHQRLEQVLVSQSSLRNSIVAVREHIMSSTIAYNPLTELAPIILRLLSDQVDIQQASLYATNKDQLFNTKAVNSVGSSIELDLTNPLVIEAIASKKTVAIQTEIVRNQDYCCSILLAIPLTDANGNLWGMITIHKIPFRSFTLENIKLISILGDYIGDLLGQKISPAFTQVKDQQLRYFLMEMQRCIENIVNYDIPSTVICLKFNSMRNLDALKTIFLSNMRSLDQSCEAPSQDGSKLLFILLPLTNSAIVNLYKSRLKRQLKKLLTPEDYQATRILFHKHDLLPTDKPVDVLYKMTMTKKIKKQSRHKPVKQLSDATSK